MTHEHEHTHTEDKSLCQRFEHAIGHKRTVSLVFLGIGLTLFLLNITGMLTYLPSSYNVTSFNLSIFSSIIIIIYTTYILHEEN